MKLHGGDIYGISEKTGIDPTEWLDFSANINPLGIPDGVMKAMVDSLSQTALHYPDPDCRQLVSALGQYHGIPEDEILCGNGAADLIYRLVYALKPQKALVLAPTFMEYQEALAQVGTEVVIHHLDDTFYLTESILDDMAESIDMMFLCNPNNPTGLLIDQNLLHKVLMKAQKCGILVVLDESFVDFVENSQCVSMVKLLDTFPNLLILRSFTKFYAIPGIRLGYAMSSDRELLRKIKLAGQTWPVSSVAVAAGVAALHETEFQKLTIEYVAEARMELRDGLKKLGFRVLDGQADYLMFQVPYHQTDDEDLYEKLLQEQMIIRRCSNFVGLDETFYRVAVKKKEENQRLLEILEKILHEEKKA